MVSLGETEEGKLSASRLDPPVAHCANNSFSLRYLYCFSAFPL